MSAPPPRQKFFISYAHGDPASARLLTYLADELKKAGHDVFTDRNIDDLWGDELTQHIAACDAFVVLISEAALRSDGVLAEVEIASERFTAEKRPRVFVIRLSDKKFNVQWRMHLGKHQSLSPTTTEHLTVVREWILGIVTSAAAEAKIRGAKVARRRRALIGIGLPVTLLLTALLVYFFVLAPLSNIRRLRSASPAIGLPGTPVISLSEAKNARRTGRVGWPSRAADADAAYAQFLRRWSDAHLAKATKLMNQGEVAKGFVLAALVAQENGGKLDDVFRGVYVEGNYASLKQTLRTGSTLGAGLAVSSDGTQIAAGNTLWNLAASTRCSLAAGAVNVVAFGPLGLYTGGNEEVTQWTNCRSGAQIPVTDERVQDLAVAQDGTVAVVVRKGTDVLLHKGLTELPLPHAEPVRSVAFADDGSFLVTTSGKLLSVWNLTVRNHPPKPNRIDTGLSLRGAALNGDYVAVNGAQKVKIWRLRPGVQFVREVAPPSPVRSIALSEDAVLLAMVSEEGVFSDRVARVALRRIGARQSVTSDVVFSDVRRLLIVKRADAVELWDPEPSSADADDPEHRLARWMDKFALTVDENGRITPRVWSENR